MLAQLLAQQEERNSSQQKPHPIRSLPQEPAVEEEGDAAAANHDARAYAARAGLTPRRLAVAVARLAIMGVGKPCLPGPRGKMHAIFIGVWG